jgi:hypothetical protein
MVSFELMLRWFGHLSLEAEEPGLDLFSKQNALLGAACLQKALMEEGVEGLLIVMHPAVLAFASLPQMT